ncbi:hypothetical protein D3C81_1801920 [compost metagenome]
MMMVMLRCICPQIVTGHAVSEIDLLHDMKLTEQFQGTIDSSETDLWSFLLHQHEDVFCA